MQFSKQNVKPNNSNSIWGKDRKLILILGAPTVLLFFFAFLGNFHIVQGSGIEGFKFIRKASFTFDETFINIDKITGMPYFAAQMRYPLATRALQREGYIESESQLKKRAVDEFTTTVNTQTQEILKEINR